MNKNAYKQTAFPTIGLFIVSISLWMYSLYLGMTEELHPFTALLFCSLCSYLNFTPMHDICHRSVFFKNSKLIKILENILGHLSAATLFIPYDAFKILHLQHHSFTNIKDKDPDYWVNGTNPLLILLKALTIKISYYFFVIFKPSTALKKKRINVIISLSLLIFILNILPNTKTVCLIWLGSSILSLTMLAILFDWLPHTPHTKTERYTNTRIIDKSWLTPIMVYQNYHLIHHLYPRIPFYLYKKKFEEVKEELISKGSPLI